MSPDPGGTEEAGGQPLVIDGILGQWDASIARHGIVEAGPHATYEAARALDFRRVEDPIVSAAFFLRGLPARLRGVHEAPPERIVLGEPDGLRGWVVLGLAPDREIAFGAIGEVWQPRITWREVPAESFAAFAEPGLTKLACAFVVSSYGATRSLLTYECRVLATDAAARASFLRYFELVRPVVGHVLAATVRVICADAARVSGGGR